MGIYINAPGMGAVGKADVLIQNYGGVEIESHAEVGEDEVKVFVVNNGPFEAAGVAYSQAEESRFRMSPLYGDTRPVRVVKMKREEAAKHVGDEGYAKAVLTGERPT